MEKVPNMVKAVKNVKRGNKIVNWKEKTLRILVERHWTFMISFSR